MHIIAASLAATLLLGCGSPGQTRTSEEAESSAGTVVQELDPRIWQLHQARDGSMWFGSNGDGVYRLRENVLTRFGPEHGLVGGQVRDLAEDKHGRVLVGTSAGVSMIDGEGVHALEVVDEPDSSTGWVLDPDDVWIVFDPGGPKGGPCRFDGETLRRLRLPRNPAAEVDREPYERAGFEPEGVYSIHRDRRGHVWFGTAGAGLCRFDGESLRWMYLDSITTTPGGGAFGIRSIMDDADGAVWICNTRQRFRLDGESEATGGDGFLGYTLEPGVPDAGTDESPNFRFFSSIVEDPAGALWMACGKDGVLRFDGEEVTLFPVGEEAWAVEVLCDDRGTIWVGTLGDGVFTIDEENGVRAFDPSRR